MKIGWDGGKAVYDDDFAVYSASPRSMSSAVPEELQSCFQEARSCYQVRAYTASAIMCRRTLELLAIERGINERSLDKALRKLQDAGHIDQQCPSNPVMRLGAYWA